MHSEEIVLLVAVGLLFVANLYGWGKEFIHWLKFKKMKKEVRGDDSDSC